MRIIEQKNLWGKAHGAEPQRADLWTVDFSEALRELSTVLNDVQSLSTVAIPTLPLKIATYSASAVSLPDLRVRGEPVRRDSRNYQMPSWDEPCELARILFTLDCAKTEGMTDPYKSDIYQLLDVWRAVARAGRGAMSSEYSLRLDSNYRIDYAHTIRLNLLRGATTPRQSTAGPLEVSLQLSMVNAWLASFKLTELTYEGSRLVQIESNFYVEDILQDPVSVTGFDSPSPSFPVFA